MRRASRHVGDVPLASQCGGDLRPTKLGPVGAANAPHARMATTLLAVLLAAPAVVAPSLHQLPTLLEDVAALVALCSGLLCLIKLRPKALDRCARVGARIVGELLGNGKCPFGLFHRLFAGWIFGLLEIH
jgi:hypothetical protein